MYSVSFAMALLAATASANKMKMTSARVPTTARYDIEKMENGLEFWYENTQLRARWETTFELKEPIYCANCSISVAAFLPYDPAGVAAADKWIALMCNINIDST